ncbi:hypothetical protein NIES267_37670 [Calothrix parasitica NIES-267]|uniref:Uncharacterized protein n=1 Tax=Calothrix parasitica NIES-267 TaxID=1973488 RepID=A0A1Z4LSY7_9CYAN|nr:hypothetical protein NIES267_37670 [Calothrix parasitica NIES-267]
MFLRGGDKEMGRWGDGEIGGQGEILIPNSTYNLLLIPFYFLFSILNLKI